MSAEVLLFNIWKQSWMYMDISQNSPRQLNGDNCGVFTLASTSLLSNDTNLTLTSYSQATVLPRDARRRLTLAICRSSLETPGTPWLPEPSITHTATTAGTSAAVPTPYNRSRCRGQRIHKQGDQRLVLGEVRMQRKLSSTVYTPVVRGVLSEKSSFLFVNLLVI